MLHRNAVIFMEVEALPENGQKENDLATGLVKLIASAITRRGKTACRKETTEAGLGEKLQGLAGFGQVQGEVTENIARLGKTPQIGTAILQMSATNLSKGGNAGGILP